MKKVLIIAGGLALIGGVVYFYSKNKKAEDKDTSATNPTTPTTPTSGTTPTPASTSVANTELAPLQVAYGQVEINLEKAQDIVRKMLKGKKWSDVKISTLKSINAKLSKLGYQYSEGILKKI